MSTTELFILIFFAVSMFANGSLFIPQALKIYKNKCSKDLSFITFLGFNLIQLATLLHGYAQKDWALIVGMGYSFFTCGIVSFLIYYYRKPSLVKLQD